MSSSSTRCSIGKWRWVFVLLLGAVLPLSGQPLSPEALAKMPIYTSLDEALQNPQEVYRFRWRGRIDSLPDALFTLTNLQELTLSGCRLMVLNAQIGELQQLQYLNLSRNRLVRLPEEIGTLQQLQTLIINRNLIGGLPESIGNLTALRYLDAWGNPLYELPKSIAKLQHTLTEIDLRQIALHNDELEKMEQLLPHTRIRFTSTCDCNDGRDP